MIQDKPSQGRSHVWECVIKLLYVYSTSFIIYSKRYYKPQKEQFVTVLKTQLEQRKIVQFSINDFKFNLMKS